MAFHRLLPSLAGLVLSLSFSGEYAGASPLLESVKQNKQLAQQLCGEFRKLNASGQKAHGPAAVRSTAASQGLSTIDAEILNTYVVGMYCPEVR
ncbi:hypothetical protein [Synechococcus sp. UW140]|uniref:hypothetical protein n=1 Tax=Synechococcus sp. UW140 TaxID=368503 RepID=UPI003137BB4E